MPFLGAVFLKWIVANPSVTCAIPATGKARHLEDNAGRGGRLPDAKMRRMLSRFFAQDNPLPGQRYVANALICGHFGLAEKGAILKNRLRRPICRIPLFMQISPLLVIALCCLAFYPRPAKALVTSEPKSKFAYKDASGKKQSVEIVDKYQPKKIVRPLAKIDSKIDPKLCRAATIAQERARAHSLSKCWRYVKEALVAPVW